MLTVDDYDRIRRGVLVDGKSQREVAKELGHSRHTVKKALEYGTPPGYRRKKPPNRPAIGPVSPIIDAWLEDDKKRPRKQRHTAQRIYERLCDEHGFTGSYSAVRRYVQHKKATEGDVYFPLVFDPGEEMQVDWGEARFIENGVERKASIFCARLCYSSASFARAYERENQECLLDGHVHAYNFFEGVAHQSAYDNMKTAVITVGRGRERFLTEGFRRLRSHYLFESRFCNVRSPHEKGHVENLVKHCQRKFMTPLPEVSSLEELNAHLMSEIKRDLGRIRGRSSKSVGELLDEERQYLLPLPMNAFEACKQESSFVTKQALVRFDKNDYSVPVRYAHHRVVIKGFVDRVDLVVNDESVASHPREYGSGEYVLDPYHYIPLLERKPGGIHNARPFKGEPWGEDFEVMRRELEYRYGGEGTKKFIKVLLLFVEFPVEDVKEAVRVCVKRRAFSEDAVYGVLTYRPRCRIGTLDLSSRPELMVEVDGKGSLIAYDSLIPEGPQS